MILRLAIGVFLLAAAFLPPSVSLAEVEVDLDRACPNCSPYFCPANPETKRLLDEKRALARERGYPQRIVNLLDQANPSCPACIEQGASVPLIYLFPADNQDSPLEWTANNERIARSLFRSGRIDAYYIRWIGPCDCCGSGKPPSFFDSAGAVRSSLGVGDGVLRYETAEQVDAVTDAGGSKKPIPEVKNLPDPKQPRIAQALCRECEAAANAINVAEQAHYEALRAELERKREVNELDREDAKLHNALVDLYNGYDAEHISWETYLKESERLSKRQAALDHRRLSRTSVPIYRRNLAAIRSTRMDVEKALARAQDCEARLCGKPDDGKPETANPSPDETMTGAPPAKHGLKPTLICGRFPKSYWEPCFQQILTYYALAEAHAAAKQGTNKRAACLKGCAFVRAPWNLADWARRTALKVIEENRVKAMDEAGSQARRAEVQAWFEQAYAFWSETNTAINSCTKAEAERRFANCHGACIGAGASGGALLCAIHPLNAATQYQWLSNLYPPGAPELSSIQPDTPAALAQRRQLLDGLRAAETPAGRPSLPNAASPPATPVPKIPARPLSPQLPQ